MRPLPKGTKPKLNPRELIRAKRAAATSAAAAAADKPKGPRAAKLAAALLDDALLAKAHGSGSGRVAAAGGGAGDSNAVILPAPSSRKASPMELPPAAPKALSKREQRKLLKLAEQKVRAASAREALSQLEAHALSAEQQRLLRSSGEMGKKDTHRERIQRQLREGSARHRYRRRGESRAPLSPLDGRRRGRGAG